jgi:type I restriction-modification system DNA methylase subunit
MPLINSRLFKKILQPTPMPSRHFEILSKWRESIVNKTIFNENETALDSHFIQQILIEILGYQDFGDQRTLWKNKAIASGNVDVALGHFSEEQDQIIAPFELKGAKTKLDNIMAGRHKTPVQQAWEYAIDTPKAQWVLVSNYLEIRLYAVGYGRQVYETWDLSRLIEPLEYARFQLLLNAKQLLSGETTHILRQSEQVEKEITNELYLKYKSLRERLLETLTIDNPHISALDLIYIVQKILDRVLFIAFAEDRGLLPDKVLELACEKNLFNPYPLWENFKGLFRAINEGNETLKIAAYNGGLFQTDLQLENLVVKDHLCNALKELSEYDFDSEVSVTVLGHIFEQSISDIEILQTEARGEQNQQLSKRKRDGIYYTPPYITHYIVEQAVGSWLKDRQQEIGFDNLPNLNQQDFDSIRLLTHGKRKGMVEYNDNIAQHLKAWEGYKNVLSNIKVLDPACGSGAFLNEVFDYLYREGQRINDQLTFFNAGQVHLFRWDTHILSNNIYGVDINYESVEITKLSLWLKTANKQEKLTYLDDNIKCGNSLIDDEEIAGNKAFKWEKEFPQIFQSGGFDIIVGNPPYIPTEAMSSALKNEFKTAYPILERKFDSSVLFIIKGLNLLNKDGYLSYISSITWQTGENYKNFRKFIFDNYGLLKMVNLPFNTFSDAYVDTCIYLISKNKSESYDVFCFDKKEKSPSLKEIVYQNILVSEIQPPEYKLILNIQSHNILNKIKLNSSHIRLGDITKSTQGLSKSLYKLVDTKTEDYNFSFFDSGSINRYKFIVNNLSYTNFNRKESLFFYYDTNEKILIRRIISRQDRLLVTCVNQKIAFTKDISPFILIDDSFSIKYLLCILASKLISYFYINSSSIAVKDDFRQTTLAELRAIPIIQIEMEKQLPFIERADKMLNLTVKLNSLARNFVRLLTSEFKGLKANRNLENWYLLDFADFLQELTKAKIKLSLQQKAEWMDYFNLQKEKVLPLKTEIEKTDQEIDQLVYCLYGLTDEEIKLIEESYLL